MARFTLFFALIILSLTTHSQLNWKLKSSKDSMNIYTAEVPGSKLNAIRIVTNVSTTMSALAAVMLDIDATAEWVYSTKSIKVLKQVSPYDIYYYSELSFPWPTSNRDFVAHIILNQDPLSKVMTLEAINVSEMVPVKPGIVRVSKSIAKWTFTPLSKNLIRVEYMLECDPGGSLPSWLINLFSTKGPYESFKKLRTQLQKPVYRQARYSFIKD